MSMIALAFALLLGSTNTSTADDKEQIEKLRKESAELKAQLAAKEAELAKLDPVEMMQFLQITTLKPNTVGPFGSLTEAVIRNNVVIDKGGRLVQDAIRVEKVLDGNRVIASVLVTRGREVVAAKEQLLITGFDTTGVADGKIINPSPVFRVIGTKMRDGKTYHHLEHWTQPYTPSKK